MNRDLARYGMRLLLLAILLIVSTDVGAYDLDAILRAAKPGDVVQLEAGVYITHGSDTSGTGVSIPAGSPLIGRGMSTTVIQFIPPDTWDRDFIVLRGLSGSSVSNLTVDGGLTTPAGWKRNIVSMVGDGCTVSGVRALGAWGDLKAGRESFGIACHKSTPAGYSADGLIVNCEVSHVLGDYVTALKVDGGKVLNSLVIFPDPKPGVFWTGLGWCQSPGATFAGNEIRNAVNGAYTDTGNSTNVVIVGNRFVNVVRGVRVNCQWSPTGDQHSQQGLTFSTNTVWLQATASEVAAVQLENFRFDGIDDDTGNTCGIRDVLVTGNTIGWAPGIAPPTNGAQMAANLAATGYEIRNVKFIANHVAASLKWRNWKLRADATVTTTVNPWMP
jgi:hypothetical protein